MKYYKIGIAGSGNVAWHLAQDLEKAGHEISVVFSRNLENAQFLASQLYDTVAIDLPDFSDFNLDLLIIAIKDDAIDSLVQHLLVNDETVVAHSSGICSLEVLSPLGQSIGVFYPLQSFTKERAVHFSEIPICLEFDNPKAQEILFRVAKSLSNKVIELPTDKRKILHLAAVFANNFTNHMLFWAQTLLETEEINWNFLEPLAKETIKKAFALGPEKSQTGPAKRNDLKTMEIHESIIASNPELLNLYRTLSKSIRANHL